MAMLCMSVCITNFNIIRPRKKSFITRSRDYFTTRCEIDRERTGRAAKGKDNKSGRKIFPVPMTNTISPNFGHLYTLRPG